MPVSPAGRAQHPHPALLPGPTGFATLFLILVVVFVGVTGVEAATAPDWLQEAARLTAPDSLRTSGAVALLREARVEYEASGRRTIRYRRAVLILDDENSSEAVARVPYRADAHRIKKFGAWLLDPDGQVERYGDDEAVDAAMLTENLFTEARIRYIVPSRHPTTGSVFGFEVEIEEDPLFLQFEWPLRESLPVVRSTLFLKIPRGWSADCGFLDCPPIPDVPEGSWHSWQAENVPGPSGGDEILRASAPPRLTLTLTSTSADEPLPRPSFSAWEDVSTWLEELFQGSLVIDGQVGRLAAQLSRTAGSELDSVRAVASFVQRLRYVSIQMGLNRGGGYLPRPPTDVLATAFGDCKDKSNLMRALLGALGIDSRMVVTFSGDPERARTEWPSPQQFNHCIIGIPLSSDPGGLGSVVRTDSGLLLLFDPTDPHTVLGDIPAADQGSLALTASEAGSGPFRIPRTPPDWNRLEREISLSLADNGSATGTAAEWAGGQPAAAERAAVAWLTPSEQRLSAARRLGRRNDLIVDRLEVVDNAEDGLLRLDMSFHDSGAADVLGAGLIMFPIRRYLRPAEGLELPDETGSSAGLALSRREILTIILPSGYVADELPDPVDFDEEFGWFRADSRVSADTVTVEFEFRVDPGSAAAPVAPLSRASFADRLRSWSEKALVLVPSR